MKLGPPNIPHGEVHFDLVKDLVFKGANGTIYKGTFLYFNFQIVNEGICRNKTVGVKVPAKQNLNALEQQAFEKEIKIMRY